MQNMMRSKCIYCQGRGFKTHPDGYGGINTVYCPDCFGTGYAHGTGGFSTSDGNMMQRKCIYCQGRGFNTYPDGYGGINTVSCPDCFGTGYLT